MKTFFYRYILLLTLLIQINLSCLHAQVEIPARGVWMTYYNGKNLEEDFMDMKNHGVDAVETGIWGIEGNNRPEEILKAARKTGMKIIVGLPEVSEEAFKLPVEQVERAVMLGGAYNGKAIDRFRFSFTPEKHSILIESPVYDSTNCYGSIGRYFMGLTPVKAEVIIKLADFDGRQHLKIVDARIEPLKEHFQTMTFDLTGAEGDLENVLLAVYWTSEGTRDYWIFGDAVSLFSDGLKDRLQEEVTNVVNAWKRAGGGEFPPEIIAMRYGDECFHLSGHLNSDACSYPMWDYSESAAGKFRELYNGEMPRGVGFTDVFGHEAYACWMYNFHEAAARSVKFVKECLEKNNVGHLPVFRNTTRMNVFDVLNDYDGSGQELLSKVSDIIHLDPYPVNNKGFNQETIPRDMAYMEGFARRFRKPVVPWMQAHVYGHLQHPGPGHISEMMEQHKQFNIHSIMWLGYGYKNSGNTFPVSNAASWERARQEHLLFKDYKPMQAKADFAVVRPYTARSVRGLDSCSADWFLTNYLLEAAALKARLRYDAFEPLDCSRLSAEDLVQYPFIVAETGIVSEKNLQPFIASGRPCILIIAGAEAAAPSLRQLGIKEILKQDSLSGNANHPEFTVLDSENRFVLEPGCMVIYESDNGPAIWRKGNMVLIGKLPVKNGMQIAEDLLAIFRE